MLTNRKHRNSLDRPLASLSYFAYGCFATDTLVVLKHVHGLEETIFSSNKIRIKSVYNIDVQDNGTFFNQQSKMPAYLTHANMVEHAEMKMALHLVNAKGCGQSHFVKVMLAKKFRKVKARWLRTLRKIIYAPKEI